jgi:hypothetical protein
MPFLISKISYILYRCISRSNIYNIPSVSIALISANPVFAN